MVNRLPFVSRRKYQAAVEAARILHERAKESVPFKERYIALADLMTSNDYQMLAVKRVGNIDVVAFLKNEGYGERAFFLYQVIQLRREDWVCRIDVKYLDRNRVYLIDWHCKCENIGYGSFLLKQAILYLECAGFSYLLGKIEPADFDHEEKLKHIYRKFGFDITEFPNERRLVLHLKEDEAL